MSKCFQRPFRNQRKTKKAVSVVLECDLEPRRRSRSHVFFFWALVFALGPFGSKLLCGQAIAHPLLPVASLADSRAIHLAQEVEAVNGLHLPYFMAFYSGSRRPSNAEAKTEYFPVRTSTQENGSTLMSRLAWQDSPGPATPLQGPASEAVRSRLSASLTGTVRDSNGAVVPGVPVTLLGQDDAVKGVVTADNKGAFTFAGLAPGTYQVKIDAAGLEPIISAAVVLGADQKQELPVVVTRIPTERTTVHVTATLNEVAQAQVQEQEKQRVLGFVPNYFSSYIWTAAPMTPKLKFQLSLKSVIDPFTFLIAAGLAGVEQQHNTFPGYGQEAEGYGKRFGAAYADAVISRMVSRAILPTVFHQDPRYFYRGSGSIRSRILYALAATVVCRGDNGRLQPNYSQLFGNFAAAGISNLYRAPGDRQASLTFRNGLVITASGAVENLLREFLSRKLTSNVPSFANGKP